MTPEEQALLVAAEQAFDSYVSEPPHRWFSAALTAAIKLEGVGQYASSALAAFHAGADDIDKALGVIAKQLQRIAQRSERETT